MNYKELVLSKTPSIYIPYDGGNNLDIVGARLRQNYSSDLNPLYDHTTKAHGMRGKKIGHNGSGSYDYRAYIGSALSSNTNVYHCHIEAWVYLPSAVYTQNMTIGWIYTEPTTGQLYPSSLRITTARYISWTTQSRSGSQDHSMTSVNQVPLDSWTHIAVQIERTGSSTAVKRIYINGVLDSEVSGNFSAGVSEYVGEATYSANSIWIDEFAVWHTNSTTKPANFPTAADILQRATFPRVKPIIWDATNQFYIVAGDAQYWNGSQWVSMQDMTWKHWNGTEWVTL